VRVTADLSPQQISQLLEQSTRIEVAEPLSVKAWDQLREATKLDPEKALHIYGDNSLDPSLNRLAGFEHLRHLSIHVSTVTSFEELGTFSALQTLALGDTKAKDSSLGFIRGCKSLQEAWIEGHSKDISALTDVSSLRVLRLRALRVKDFEFMRNLPVERVEILYSKVRDLRPLAFAPKLSRLWLGRIRGLTGSDLAPLRAKPLGLFALNDQPGVQDLSYLGAPDIVHLSLDNLSHIESLEHLRAWPVLTMLGLRKSVPSDGSLIEVAKNAMLRHIAIATTISDAELKAITAVFEGDSLSYRGGMIRGERPLGIIASRLDL
jgi:hypothetical protein